MVQFRLSKLVCVDKVFDGEYVLSELHLLFLNIQADIAADHQTRNFLLRHVARVVNAHRAPAAHDRQPVGDLHDLVQLVRDEDDGIALLL